MQIIQNISNKGGGMKSEQEVLKQAYLPNHHQPTNINQVHRHRGIYYAKYYGGIEHGVKFLKIAVFGL